MKNITQITVFQNEEFAKYSFVTILLRILQFSQNTKKLKYFCAKYSLKYYAKYKSLKKLLRKIQSLFFRKIQSSSEIVPQNTVQIFCVWSSQNTDFSQNTISLIPYHLRLISC